MSEMNTYLKRTIDKGAMSAVAFQRLVGAGSAAYLLLAVGLSSCTSPNEVSNMEDTAKAEVQDALDADSGMADIECTPLPSDPCRPCQHCGDKGMVCTTLSEGENCDDKSCCTLGDQCMACDPSEGDCPDYGMQCVGSLKTCEPSAQCLVSSCTCANDVPQCGEQIAPDGFGCEEDASQCYHDFCEGGVCKRGSSFIVDDGNKCTAEECVKGQVVVNKNVTGDCDDGDPCTTDDHCYLGTCTYSKLMDCPPPLCASSASCVEGECVSVWAPVGGACDDGNPCTTGETCAEDESSPGARKCVGQQKDCDDHDPCTEDSCDPETVECINTHITGPCDDENPCTEEDTCTEDGECVGTAMVCPGSSDPCSISACDPLTGECGIPALDGTPCADSDLCDGSESCANGLCVAGTPVDCGNVTTTCMAQACNAATGACNLIASDGTVCETTNQCLAGACVDCVDDTGCTDLADDGNECSLPQCNPATHKCQQNLGARTGQLCGSSVATACDKVDTCDADGVCQPNFEPITKQCRPSAGVCDIVEFCDELGGCPADAFKPITTECRLSAGICDVGEFCTGDSAACPDDAKSVAQCRPATGECDLAEVCDGVGDTCPGDDLFKTDSTTCGFGDQCVGGLCQDCLNDSGCEDLPWGIRDEACSVRLCTPEHMCGFNDLADGIACGTNDQCVGGSCKDCVDVDSGCADLAFSGRDDECASRQCVGNQCVFAAQPAGTPCDRLATGTADQCDGEGMCVDCVDLGGCAGLPDDQNPCTDVACINGACQNVNDDSSSCEDGHECTANACVDGACVAPAVTTGCFIDGRCEFDGEKKTVSGDGSCQRCESSLSTLEWTIGEAGEACDDGDELTIHDECGIGGECAGIMCTPSCDAIHCNDDGCGGACPCGPNQVCWPSGICAPNTGGSCGDMSGLQAGAPWPMEAQCPTHQARSKYKGPQTAALRWIYAPPGARDMRRNISVGINGDIYIGGDADFLLHRVTSDNSQAWTYQSNCSVDCVPAIGHDGTIYGISTCDSGLSQLFALHPNGSQKWATGVSSNRLASPTIGPDGTIYFGEWLRASDQLYAYTQDGQFKWASGSLGGTAWSPAIGLDGRIYKTSNISGQGGHLKSIDPESGNIIWSLAVGTLSAGWAATIGADESIYVLSADNTSNTFVNNIGPDAVLRWRYESAYPLVGNIGIGNTGILYIASSDPSDAKIIALYPDGTEKWIHAIGPSDTITSPIIDAFDNIYLGAGSDIIALNSDGQEIWRYPTGEYIDRWAMPAIGSDGVLYMPTYDLDGTYSGGKVFAIGECVPQCHLRECGDSCGVVCGACPSGSSCNSQGQCTQAGVTWKTIPKGIFQMGCSAGDAACVDHEKPAHAVTVSEFQMLETEVTEAQYLEVMGTDPSCDMNGGGGAASPVECVTWFEATAFCQGVGGRLPTEAEWEYAARAGTLTKFPCGNDWTCLDSSAWYDDNSGGHKHEVKNRAPNSFGLYDMSGNVWEWVEDWIHDSYTGAPDNGYPAWTIPGGLFRVIRGGSFGHHEGLRVSYRGNNDPPHGHDIGFRCARSCDLVCSAKECGPDNCGGTCGTCADNETCNPDGQCDPIVPPTEIVLKPEAIVVSDDVAATVDNPYCGTMMFPLEAGMPPFEVQPDDVIVSGYGDGFLCRVLDVTVAGDELVLTTEQASLTDVVESGTLEFSVPLAIGDPLAKGPVKGPVSASLTIPSTELYSKNGITVTLRPGSLTFQPDLDVRADYGLIAGPYFRAVVSGSLVADAGIDVELDATASIDGQVTVYEHSFPFYFQAGPLPVAGRVVVSVKPGFSASAGGTASSSFGGKATRTVTAGAEYSDHQWRNINVTSQSSTERYGPELDASVSLDAEVKVDVKAELLLYESASANIIVTPRIEGNVTPHANWSYDWDLNACVWGGYGGEIEIFHHALVNYDATLFNKCWSLWNGSGCIDQCSGESLYCSNPGTAKGCGEMNDGDTCLDLYNKECSSSQTCQDGACVGECTSGACCDTAAQRFKASGTACGTAQYQYLCDQGTDCGSDISRQKNTQRCTGNSSECTGNWSGFVGDGTVACDTTHKCVAGQSACGSCSTDACSSGDCCDTSPNPNVFRPSSYACEFAVDYQWACLDGTGCGSDVYVQYSDRYCPGNGSQCTGALGEYGTWEVSAYCGSDQRCNQVTGNCEPCACAATWCQTNNHGGDTWCKDSDTKVTCGTSGACYTDLGTSDCSGSLPYCSGGVCVQCTSNSQCQNGYFCTNNQCVAAACGGAGQSCCGVGTCTAPYYCSGGTCINVCGNGVCDFPEDPYSCGQDCDPTIGTAQLYYKNSSVSAIACTSSCPPGSACWRNGVSGTPPKFVLASSCSVPADNTNLYTYQGYNARWHLSVKKSGYYTIYMYYPGTESLCTISGIDPANRYAGNLRFGLTQSGSTGVVSDSLTFSSSQYNIVFDMMYMAEGDHYIVLYDNAQNGNVCNTGGSTSNKWVIADEIALEFLWE